MSSTQAHAEPSQNRRLRKVSWLIENITKEQSLIELAQAIKDGGGELVEINGDYTADVIKELRNYVAGKTVIFDGSLNMCEVVLRDIPGATAIGTPQNYLCSRYYGSCGDLLFNDRYAMMPLADLHRNPLVATFARESCLFIRPDGGQKEFRAGIVTLGEVQTLSQRYPDMLVVVSSPKNIAGEWRFVCESEGIVALSSYRIRTNLLREPTAPEGAVAMCNTVLKRYQPDKLFVVDVCCDEDGNFWLMEFNQFTGAGLYACDKAAIVRAVERVMSPTSSNE